MKLNVFGYEVLKIERSEKRSATSNLQDPKQWLLDALGGGTSKAGTEVTESTAQNFSAVWRAISVISGGMATLPLHVYTKGDSRERVKDHATAMLLEQPNQMHSNFTFKEFCQANLLMGGNAYAYIARDRFGVPGELIPYKYNQVDVTKSKNRLYYRIPDVSGSTLLDSDVLHVPGLSFDGIKGRSVLAVMRESVGLALAAQQFGSQFFGNGANMSGVLETPNQLNDVQYERLRKSWSDKYKGIDKSGETAILEGGLKYTRIGIPPEDAQFLQTRQFQIAEIARYFGVQPHLLMDLERSTNNNIEHQGIEFVIYTILPWARKWEEELNRKLFTASDRSKYYAEFDLNGLMRGDAKTRGEFYGKMFSIGSLSPNEIRKMENMNAYEGGEKYYVQGGFVPTDMVDAFVNKGSTINNTQNNGQQ